MPPKIHAHKRRGEWVELQFMARATGKGFTVSKPWGDSARYDFAVEHNGQFHRVQVKSTIRLLQSEGAKAYACNTVRRYVNGKDVGYGPGEIDFFALFIIPEELWYIVPYAATSKARTSLLLKPYAANNCWFKYLEAWDLLRE